MAVRIDISSEDSKTIVRVSGRLVGPGVQELLNTCNSIEGGLLLDFTDLRSVDPEGIKAIRRLVGERAKFRGISPFIRLLLDAQKSEDAD